MSETLNRVNGLYETMDMLQQAVNRVSASWNDTVSSAINVNHINTIIQRCNATNAQIQSEASVADAHIGRMHQLLSEY